MYAKVPPIWSGHMVHNESLLMITEDGNTARAPLLFIPTEITLVQSARLDKQFIRGRDWDYEGRFFFVPAHSRIPVMAKHEMFLSSYVPGESMPGNDGGAVLFREGSYFHDRQIVVSYKHAGTWQGPVPEFAGKRLVSTMHKLRHDKSLKLVLYGDSISVGADCSGFSQIPPYQPIWGLMICDMLEQAYGAKVEFYNPSVGGKDSTWGKENVTELVASQRPDLVIIAFGMNDGSGSGVGDGLKPLKFKHNISSIISRVKADNPDCEFILVAPTLPNPKSIFWDQQLYYKEVLKSLETNGIVMADMTTVHAELLKHKAYHDMTGNNVNHPNDFLSRCHVDFITGLLIPTI